MSALRYARNLICPHCRSPLSSDSERAVCANGHAFDVSRRGYINLLPAHLSRSRSPGDTRAALQHRARFLGGGYFDPLADRLVMKSREFLEENNLDAAVNNYEKACLGKATIVFRNKST